MADSFLKAIWEACYKAAEAGGAEFPAACADAGVNWLRSDAPRGRGREPGWKGRAYLPTDKAAIKERHKRIIELHEFGFSCAEIAEMVNLGEGTVKNFLSRRRK